MAITIFQQPQTLRPNAKSEPFLWQLKTSENVSQAGTQASFFVKIENTGGSDGDTFEILGETFSVDEAVDYTSTSFDYSGSAENAAGNFLNMLQSNYLFNSWYLFTSHSGGVYTIWALAIDYEEKDNFTFDYSGLSTPLNDHSETNGTDTVLNDYSLWFQLWASGVPASEQRFARVPYVDGITETPVDIDLKELAGSMVGTALPSWSQSGPIVDSLFKKEFNLRFGGITKDSQGQNVFGQTYNSPGVEIVNSVFQLRELNEFKNHHPDFIGGGPGSVQWLTDRPQNYPVPLDSYEWAWILIANGVQYPVTINGFKVVYFFDYGQGVTDTFETIITTDPDNVYIVPCGTANPDLAPYMGGVIYYTVQIWGLDNTGLTWIPYSTVLTRYVKPGHCFEEEVYFLEDKGSFGTLTFRAIDEVRLLQEGPTIDTPNDGFNTGGRSTLIERAQEKCFIISESLSRRDELMKYYEQCLRSKTHYIRTTVKGISEGIPTIRRVVIDRNNSRLYKKGEKTALTLAYTFTTDLNTH